MKLRQVEISGFKSFANKTQLEFPEGLSCIVGPNGSGKSNVLDAICFALGYPSRNLRASRIPELIYSGKKKSKEAQVRMLLSNGKDGMEIRRLCDRTGKSKYKLNTKTTNLDTIREALKHYGIPRDGLNIVMQNDVNRLIEMKNKERRETIDNISGISGYEDKKRRATGELEVVERRIQDTNLILSEKKGYLEQLGKDREVALQFKGLQDELRSKKAVLVYSQLFSYENQAGEVVSTLDEIKKKREEAVTHLAKTEEQIELLSMKMEKITQKLLTSSSGESTEIQGEISGLKTAIEKKNEEIQFLRGEIQSLKQKKDDAEGSAQNVKSEVSVKEKELSELQKRVKQLSEQIKEKEGEKNSKMAEYGGPELVNLEKQRDSLRDELFTEKQKIGLLEKEMSNLDSKEEELKTVLGKDNEELERLKNTLDKINKEKKSLSDKLTDADIELNKQRSEKEKAGQSLKKVQQELTENEERLTDLYKQYARLESEIKTLENMEEKLGDKSIRFVLENKHKMGGVHGLVSELGDAPNEYKTALEVAAGKKMNYVVVENDVFAQKYIQELRQRKIGRVTFLPLNKLRPPNIREVSGPGIIGYARELVACEEKYQKVFDYIYGDVLVVKDIEAARKTGINKYNMVTLDGDYIAAGGAMTGGFYKKQVISFSSLAEKREDLESIMKNITRHKNRKEDLEKEYSKLQKSTHGVVEDPAGQHRVELEVLKERSSNLETTLSELKESMKKREQLINGFDEERNKLKKRSSEAKGTVERLEKKESSIAKRLNANMLAEMNEALSSFDNILEELRGKKLDLETQFSGTKNDIIMLNDRISATQTLCSETSESIKKYEQKIKQSLDEINHFGASLKESEARHDVVSKESKDYIKQQQELNKKIQELGEDKGALEAKVESLRETSNQLEIEKAKLDSKLDELRPLTEEFKRPSEKELEEAKVGTLKGRVKELEKQLSGIGDSVNLKAVEMYDDLLKQYDDIKNKNERLYIEKEKIYDLISTIEEKKRKVFFDFYERVKINFKRIISDLYPGTEGDLCLDNEASVFDSGLLIEVRPGGRDLRNIDSLSGGEKTLTAVAFLLAVQTVNDSPFYILDEVDAALDQQNVLRLVKFLKKRSEQFILVSHNTETVKHVDAVIGVSMQNGISRIVGVDMEVAA